MNPNFRVFSLTFKEPFLLIHTRYWADIFRIIMSYILQILCKLSSSEMGHVQTSKMLHHLVWNDPGGIQVTCCGILFWRPCPWASSNTVLQEESNFSVTTYLSAITYWLTFSNTDFSTGVEHNMLHLHVARLIPSLLHDAPVSNLSYQWQLCWAEQTISIWSK